MTSSVVLPRLSGHTPRACTCAAVAGLVVVVLVRLVVVVVLVRLEVVNVEVVVVEVKVEVVVLWWCC
ncbi:unnamed protein product [Gadus morhua 'NCC']